MALMNAPNGVGFGGTFTNPTNAIPNNTAQNNGFAGGSTAKSSLTNLLQSGVAQSQAAVDNARTGLGSVLQYAGQAAAAANGMTPDIAAVRGQAGKVDDTAGKVMDQADALKPYADILGGYGDDLWAQGQSLAKDAKDVFGQGKALVGMDRSAGGLAGEFIKYWNSLSPDRYVSQAASDVQGSYDNAWAQLERNNARSGQNGSGYSQALRQQYSRTLAAALVAAKTKARQTGLDMQAAQLEKMVGAADTLYNMGNKSQQSALAAQGAAADAQKGAAGINNDIANIIANAGNLQATSAKLFGDAASLGASQAGVFTNIGSLTDKAYASLTSAMQAAANYYGNAAQIEVGAYGRGSAVSSNVINNTNAAQNNRASQGLSKEATVQNPNGIRV